MVLNEGYENHQEINVGEHLGKMCAEKGISCSSDVGLNADWNCSTYLVGPGTPNKTSGAYYVVDDEENNNLILYKRRYMDDLAYNGDGYNDELIEISKEEGRNNQSLKKIVKSINTHICID